MCLHLALAHLREFTFGLITKESIPSSFDLGMKTVACLNEFTFGLSSQWLLFMNILARSQVSHRNESEFYHRKESALHLNVKLGDRSSSQ